MKKQTVFLLLSILFALPLLAQDVAGEGLEAKVVEHELENGMRFLIFERHEAPLVSMVITVHAGSVNEVSNKTGLAHLLEHLAFAGTHTIGTTDYKAEQKALAALDKAFQAYLDAESRGDDSLTVSRLYDEFKGKQQTASTYVVGNELTAIYERNGGTSLNAGTSNDFTSYTVSLPSNRFELWCAIESDRLANPVFREFYEERGIITEERLMSENDPYGVFYEEFTSISYKIHPYRNPIVGYMNDIKNMTREDVKRFYETYYVPQRMTAAIVGDVDAEEVIPLIDAYFGRIPARPCPEEVVTSEPEQEGLRRVEMRLGRMPYMIMRFPTVAWGDEDDVALDLLGNVLGMGKTSRLYRAIVEERKVASFVRAYHYSQYYAGGFVITGTPSEGVSPAELEQAVLEELAKIKDNPITRSELDAARARWQIAAYDKVSSNQWLAYQLAFCDQGRTGWQEVFSDVEWAMELEPQDLMQAAERYLNPNRRTVGILEAVDE